MGMSHDVTRPKTQACVFPERCVACGREKPGHALRVGLGSIGWYTLVFWVSGKSFEVEVPACPSCARTMRRQRLLRRALTWGFAIAGVAIAVHVLRSDGGRAKTWLAMGVALAAMAPLALWETFSAPAFDLFVGDKNVDYQFLDEALAQEFDALNPKQ